MPRWDDAQYLRFVDERTRAARELLARVPLEEPAHVVDLGCGPGNSTALLRERFPAARLLGVDSSEAMLARARRELPELTFVRADVRTFAPSAPVDLWFANALFHWVPGHAAHMVELLRALAPGGALAVQLPDNDEEPSHRLMREVALAHGLDASFSGERSAVLAPSSYYDALAPHAAWVDVWRTTYHHVMETASDIVEWLRGSGLRPYLEAVPVDRRDDFVAAYTEAIARAYPPRADGRRLFAFPRLFLVAVRAG